MSGEEKDGGPAFPIPQREGPGHPDGMSLRDWFAGQALVGLLASPRGPAGGEPMSDQLAAKNAYILADAMLAQRSNSGGKT
jgi:hypothetical protein